MSRRKQRKGNDSRDRRRNGRRLNKTNFKVLLNGLFGDGELFPIEAFHGNVSFVPEQLARQALLWAWHDTTNVTDAFEMALESSDELNIDGAAKSYTSFMNALCRYHHVFSPGLRERFQALAEETAGPFWRNGEWVLIGFDGSRVTTPRTDSNEKAFCAANYGNGATAKYRKKKTKGMRRRKNEREKPQPQTPQVWVTMMWHMGLRLPWTWRLGPSSASERGHVQEMLAEEDFPENTLFCGDAGFVGYDFWKSILDAGGDFLVRVGANVRLLSERANVKKLGGGNVLCWPKDKQNPGAWPLRLRLVKVKVGKTAMWMLTSVLEKRKLSNKKIVKYYKMRWGVEVEFRGLKQTLDKRNLRCRNSERVLIELDWSIRAMAFAELLALRAQIPDEKEGNPPDAEPGYDPKDRSLANTMRALRKTLRTLHQYADRDNDLLAQLAQALVEKYNNGTDKKARYRPKNPDKKPLGDPQIRKLTRTERAKLKKHDEQTAA
jgi:hypothetical protein